MNRISFKQGLYDGIPIFLGYISVSFSFGMMATKGGLPILVAVIISLTNLTSAGQFAGTALILSGGSFLEIAITTFIINIRYMLMSLSISQKADKNICTLKRMLLSFGITDEIFAVSMQQKSVITSSYLSGLIIMPYIGWGMGTLLGAISSTLLSSSIQSALGIIIYAMFIAILIPPATQNKAILITIIISIFLSSAIRFTPVLNALSSGWIIIICAVVASGICAKLFPIKEYAEDI